MCNIINAKITLLVATIIILIRIISGECDGYFSVTCDNLTDIYLYPLWSDCVMMTIGSKCASPQHPLNEDFFKFLEAKTILSITLIQQINAVQLKTRPSLNSVKHLKLHLNNIDKIPGELFKLKFPYLEKLELENNNIQIVDGIQFGDNLTAASLARNHIRNLKSGSFSGKGLTTLLLSHNHIRVIEEQAFSAPLITLDLSYNKLQYLHRQIFAEISQLENLDISHNALLSMESIAILTRLHVLDISYNRLETIVDELADHIYLEELNLSFNQLRRLSSKSIIPNSTSIKFFGVNLSFNLLTNIEIDLAAIPKQMQCGACFYGNPLNCNCLQALEALLYRHESVYRDTCQVGPFFSGRWPVCVAAGACGTPVPEALIEKFLQAIGNRVE